jgi:hypothetical protein
LLLALIPRPEALVLLRGYHAAGSSRRQPQQVGQVCFRASVSTSAVRIGSWAAESAVHGLQFEFVLHWHLCLIQDLYSRSVANRHGGDI